MNSISLAGIDGQHLWGFLTALGSLSLLNRHASENSYDAPRLTFQEDGAAELHSPIVREELAEVLHAELKSLQRILNGPFVQIDKPSDFTRSSYETIALASVDLTELDLLAGFACVVGEIPFESTLCSANGASQQKLIQSMRDVLNLVEVDHIVKALFSTWTYSFHLPKKGGGKEIRKRFQLGDRNPTLRLDPSDERLYALRLLNPTTTDDYATELGAQALAIPAFGVLPVVPRKQPITIASKRSRQRVTFSWPLWNIPATLHATRTLVWTGIDCRDELRTRGVFAAFSADRVTGDKGKLSFTPSRGVW